MITTVYHAGGGVSGSAVTSSLLAYGQGAVLAEPAEHEEQRRTGLDEPAWPESVAPWVRSIFDDARFLAFAQVVVAANGLGFEDRFEFGLERLLDGFGRLAASHPAAPRGS